MTENETVLEELSRDDLIIEVADLQAKLQVARATIVRQQGLIEDLQAKARQYYRAASDYVPPVERDYD